MLGLVALGKKGTGWFVFWVLLAATFHKTAVLLLPLAALAAAQNRFVAMAWGVGSLALGYWLFLEDSVENLYDNYVEAEYQSSGAMIRLAMNLVPAVMLVRLAQEIHIYRCGAPLVAFVRRHFAGVVWRFSGFSVIDGR